MDPRLAEFIGRALGVETSRAQFEPRLRSGARPDLVIPAADVTYIIECKAGRVSQAAVAQLALYQKLWETERGDRGIPVLVASDVPTAVADMIRAIGGRVIEAPRQLLGRPHRPIGQTPITSKQSWNVVVQLLRQRQFKSLRSLAKASEVSVGWTHHVVRELTARGAVDYEGAGILLTEDERILEIVQEERPIRDLQVATIPSEYSSPQKAVISLSRLLAKSSESDHLAHYWFTGPVAAQLLSRSGLEAGRVDLYVHETQELPDVASAPGGIPIRVYRPDRDIGSPRISAEGVPLASPELLLLDLAGMESTVVPHWRAVLRIIRRANSAQQ